MSFLFHQQFYVPETLLPSSSKTRHPSDPVPPPFKSLCLINSCIFTAIEKYEAILSHPHQHIHLANISPPP